MEGPRLDEWGKEVGKEACDMGEPAKWSPGDHCRTSLAVKRALGARQCFTRPRSSILGVSVCPQRVVVTETLRAENYSPGDMPVLVAKKPLPHTSRVEGV